MKLFWGIIAAVLVAWEGMALELLTLDADSVLFTGTSWYDADKIRLISGLPVGIPISSARLDSCVNKLIEAYQKQGFFSTWAVVKLDQSARRALVEVHEGPRVKIGNIVFSGNEYLSQNYLLGLMQSKIGQHLDSATIASDLSTISSAYADHGFPQAEIWLKSLRLLGDSLEIVVGVKENTLVHIGEILFQGNNTTKNEVIKRLGGNKTAVKFSREWLKNYLERLNTSGLFTSIKKVSLLPTPESGVQQLLIEVEEPKYNRFLGAVAYSQPDPNQSGWLAGMVDIGLGNIAGTGRKATLRWERPRKQNSRLEAGYHEPWLLSLDVGVDLSASHRVEDSSYVQTSAGLMLKVMIGPKVSAGFGGAVERIVPGVSQLYNGSQKYSSQWVIQSSSRDIEPSALDKFSWRFKADVGQKQYYQSESKVSIGKLWGDIGYLFELSAKHQFYSVGRGRLTVSGEKPVPRYDQFTMGGAGSLRGYYEEQFIANQIFWTNLEYRYRPVKNLTTLLFIDVGYFFDKERSLRGYRAGYGFGTNIISRIGLINVYYGLGKNDRLLNGKVHLVLENLF